MRQQGSSADGGPRNGGRRSRLMFRIVPQLTVKDVAASVAFYTASLGFDATLLDPPDNPDFASLERDDAWMQSVAAEMNLAETAFLLRRDDGFSLRWFTPTVEVDLCGHATLASAHVLWETGALPVTDGVRFYTRSGLLSCELLSGE